jgi:hypothetical protein
MALSHPKSLNIWECEMKKHTDGECAFGLQDPATLELFGFGLFSSFNEDPPYDKPVVVVGKVAIGETNGIFPVINANYLKGERLETRLCTGYDIELDSTSLLCFSND